MSETSETNESAEYSADRYALIAGNGEFPLLVLEEACRRGMDMVVLAIREEALPDIEQYGATVHWISLGELQKALGILRSEKIRKVVLAGQVRHKQIFSDIPPDPLLQQLLASLPQKNTDALLGRIVGALEGLGLEVVDSTLLLQPLLAPLGPISRRAPTREESADIAFGRRIAREIARMDLGQTVVVSEQACISVEAMEGTDACIERAAQLANGRRLTVVKCSKPGQDMRFDVPVVGANTLEVMKKMNATALALDAGRTLIIGREEFVRRANQYEIAVVAYEPLPGEGVGERVPREQP